MIWSREEDMTHDFYRPISQCKLSAGLDDNGNLVGLHARISGQSINAYLNPALITGGKDMRQLQGYDVKPGEAQLGYGAPNMLIEYVMRNTHVPVGPWRGVNTNQNAVYMECFMDEVAHAAGKDPVEFRRSLMARLPEPSRLPRRGRREGGVGHAAAGGRPSRHRPVPRLRHLLGGGRRGLGHRRQAQGASPGARDQLRPRRQSRPDRGADGRLGRLRPVGRALRRDVGQGRPHGADELRHLPAACAWRRCRRSRP